MSWKRFFRILYRISSIISGVSILAIILSFFSYSVAPYLVAISVLMLIGFILDEKYFKVMKKDYSHGAVQTGSTDIGKAFWIIFIALIAIIALVVPQIIFSYIYVQPSPSNLESPVSSKVYLDVYRDSALTLKSENPFYWRDVDAGYDNAITVYVSNPTDKTLHITVLCEVLPIELSNHIKFSLSLHVKEEIKHTENLVELVTETFLRPKESVEVVVCAHVGNIALPSNYEIFAKIEGRVG